MITMKMHTILPVYMLPKLVYLTPKISHTLG